MHNLTIRAKGKALLESTVLTVSQGRRYGLVGPNGKGKSTLLRMIARRQVPVPESLDVLLVEQVSHFHSLCTEPNTQINAPFETANGLLRPSGMGKSTLLRVIAWRQVPVSDSLGALHAEQVIK